ncbi:MAG: hypothetical protein EBZ47_05890 [Chlamydiae bacterium]|nr:hypothetical protein [Chlamydiota bacterium]
MIEKIMPDDVNPADKIGAIMPLGQEGSELGTTTQSFSTYMQNAPVAEMGTTKSQMISPFDLAQGPKSGITSPNLGTIMNQVSLAQNTMSGLQTQLVTPDLRLTESQKKIVKSKLTDANTSLKNANAKLGAPEVELSQKPTSSGPLAKFLDYVADGMNQLDSAKNQISDLKNKGSNLTPADFLMIQIKMNKAQQELDFTSVLLSKAVEDFKMMMNIQL